MPRWNYKDWKERFWKKVSIKGNNECWEWTGGKQGDGYGIFGVIENGKWKMKLAHRISWTFHFGEIPKYMKICHKCDNPKCVNPNHLFIGTQLDNVKDMVKKGRINSREGIKNPKAKLTENEVLEIRRLYASTNITFADLGKMFGISDTHSGYIVKRRVWKHI